MSLRLAAYHEAGHVVMMVLLMRTRIFAEIKTLPDGSAFGHSDCDTVAIDSLKPKERKAELLARIKILVAGMVAESIFCPTDYTPFLLGLDAKNVEECFRHLGPKITLRDITEEVRGVLLLSENKKIMRYVARTLIHYGKIQ